MLLGLLAIGFPLWLHFRHRPTTALPFPAASLLAEVAQQRSHQFRLQKRLLLAARILAIAAVVIAAARPGASVERPGGIRSGAALAQVIVLDDSLSMVDAETAVAVLKNLRESLEGTTLLVAAHRTATLLGCDELVVLEKGRVVERGSPTELLEQEESLFCAMHARQRLQTEILEAQ